MSSLWASLKKRRDLAYDSTVFPADAIPSLVTSLLEYSPVLVNATTLVADLKAERCPTSTGLDLTPGFRCIWIEYTNTYSDSAPGREAVSVLRRDPVFCNTIAPVPENARHYLRLCFWIEIDGIAGLQGIADLLIDALGEPIGDCGRLHWNCDSCNQQFAIALETLTTMNTRGTRIEPPLDAKAVQVVKPGRAPSSVWHTIHLPKMPSIPLEGVETSQTMLERREHWVRAHRRDYRHGGGMFGRVKALVWVPEFQRGNPELGTVKQTYAIHQPEARQ